MTRLDHLSTPHSRAPLEAPQADLLQLVTQILESRRLGRERRDARRLVCCEGSMGVTVRGWMALDTRAGFD
jgi:hypothetical protein